MIQTFRAAFRAPDNLIYYTDRQEAAPDPAYHGGYMKVLIVDDNSSTREMVKIILQRTGHEVIGEAGDGDAALKAFAELKPDVVLLDIIMPGKSGMLVLEEMKAMDPKAKIVMLTAVDQDEVNTRLLNEGAAAIIYKPFSYDDFEKTFNKL